VSNSVKNLNTIMKCAWNVR